tara:strand:+ start:127 stop:597 length:471 start_codon:yes stop_codon:yes gene_type:complete
MEDLKFKTAEQVMKHSNTPDRNPDFYTNANKGFAMAINGYRISVQWGPGNYVDKEIRNNDYDAPMQHSIWGCDTAEVMIWGRDDEPLFNLVPFDHDTDEYDQELFDAQGGHIDQVFGYCSSDCVARMIGCLASFSDDDPRRAIVQIYKGFTSKLGK